MPIIVPIEENHEGIARLTDAKFRAPDYSGSGLEALGAGLARLGEGGAQFASALDEKRKRELAAAIAAAKLNDDHQRYIDDAAVKNAYVDYSDKTHEALHGEDGLFNQPGTKAHAAFPGVVGTLIDNHDKALAQLDEAQRGAVAPVLGARLRSDVDLAANHVREQGKAEQQWQVEKLKRATMRDAVSSIADPDLHDHHMATGENAIVRQGRIRNLPDKEIDRQVADYKSAVHAGTIEALIAADPMRAASWYARFGDQMNDVDRRRIEGPLDAELVHAHAAADADVAARPGEIPGSLGNSLTLSAQIDPAAPTSPVASRWDVLAGAAPGSFPNLGGAIPAASDDMAALSGGDGAIDALGPNGQLGGPGPLQGDPRRGPAPGSRLPPAGRPPAQGAPAAPATRGVPRRRPDRDGLGVLSTQYETGGRGAGTVSNGKNDPGGPSYGSYQMSTNAGTAAAFANSPEFSAWAADFGNAKPGTPEFARHWKQAAASDPAAFQLAQHRFIARTHYDPAVAATLAATGLDLDTRSNALRNVVWSTAVQHGKAALLLTRAINETNKTLQPQDSAYDGALIENIYKVRVNYITALRDGKLRDAQSATTEKEKKKALGEAAFFTKTLTGRFAQQNEPANGELMWILESDIEKNWGK